ncbi:translocation/assembly module TamB domain-containing protein [Chamaesiphon sp. OTE_75_metabat_556]|uniref:translocation/assembly module TamB domain-containing protein n=1 Tax=Chamaesiphon sp. OTE_75_metabat_556 TaxID=2964692 RepID=UPI00286BDCFC|nr:translocation/assembly module TamB domain-containing protein [Chamaesiphon sp. OTE_75_metabat_556]
MDISVEPNANAQPPPQPLQPQLTSNLPPSSRRWLKLFLKTGSIIGLGLCLLSIIGIYIGQSWAKSQLLPIVEQELTKSLKRPIKLGKIEDIWLNEIHITNATIPAHGSDLNQLVVPDAFVNFNPLKLVVDRTLKLDVRVVAPQISLSQNVRGEWLNIPPQSKQSPQPIKIVVGTVRIDNAQVTILPYSDNPQPIKIDKVNLQADLNDAQDRVKFDGGAQFGSGQASISGNSSIANGATQLVVKGQKLDAAAATRIVKIPQVRIDRGTVDGDLNLEIDPQKHLQISSRLLIHDGKLTINNVPRSLDEINGFINVSERDVKFNNVTTKYDRVAGVVAGNLNYVTGYQLSAQTAPITLPDLVKSIDIKSPFPLSGAAVAQLQLTGKLDRPILAGKFNNTQLTQVDRVQIDRVNGNFKLADGRIKIDATAQPKLGGKVTTQGEIQLLKTPQTRFEFQAERLAGDALSRLYGAKLPAQVKVGDTSVRGTIEGTGAAIYTNLQVVAPQATYPVSTDLQITPTGTALIRGATLTTAAGKVLATGAITKTNWQLNLQPQGIDTQQLAKIGGLNLATNYSGKLSGNIQATGLNSDPQLDRLQASGQLKLQLPAGQIVVDRIRIDRGRWQAQIGSNALNLQQLATHEIAQATNAPIAQSKVQLPPGIISGNLQVSGNNLQQITPDNISAQGRGKIKLKAGEIQSQNLTLAKGNWQGKFTTKKLKLSEFNSQVGGQLSGEAQLTGNLNSATPESLLGFGKGEIELPQGKIVGTNLQLDRGKWQGNLQSSTLTLGGLVLAIPRQFKNAKFDGNVQVAGDLRQLKPDQISVIGNGNLSLAGGQIRAQKLEIRSGKWRGNFGIDRLKLGDFSTQIPIGLQPARLTGNFVAAGELTKFKLDRLQVNGDGQLQLAEGKVRATKLQLANGNWSSKLAIANFKLGNFNDRLSLPLQASKIIGNFNIAGNTNKLSPTAITANGDGKLRLANGGEVAATNLQLNAGEWQSNLAVRGLQLGAVNRDLPRAIQAGLLTGKLIASGDLNTPELERIQASGNGTINNLLGGNVRVDNLEIANGKWQSKAIVDRLNIGELAKFAPKSVGDLIGAAAPPANRLAGQISANWQLGGDLQSNSVANLLVAGETKLTNFQIGTLIFDRNLNGDIRANPGQGVDIAFAGQTDRLALSLDRNFQPQNFDLKQQDVIAKGSVDGQVLGINVERLPIALLQPLIPKKSGIEQYRFAGTATGNLAINLANYQVSGDRIEVTNPIFGAFQGDRLLANFRYANGQLDLQNTEIYSGANLYRLDASLQPGASAPVFQAKLQVSSGSIEDIRNLLQIFSTEDLFTPLNRRKYGTAAALGTATEKIANRPQPLNNELRRLSELRRWLNHEADRQQETNSIPNLGNLQGNFSGEIVIANNAKTGLTSDFNLAGSKWQLDRYRLDLIRAQGNLRNGKLHFEPLNLTIDNSQIDVAGDFSLTNQNAKVNIQNFPAESLASLFELPVAIKGGVNLSAQIGGNLANPRANGEISLSNGTIDDVKLQDVRGNFGYNDGRLDFSTNANFANAPIVSQQDLIAITGSIPYQLPFARQTTASENIKIDLALQNQGLQVLDIFSKQQLHWLDGQGKIALKIDGKMKPSGTIETLTARGTAKITKGRIKSIAIPEPLTDVNGEIIFDFDRVEVQKLTGKFNRGQVSVAGIIPISDALTIAENQQLAIQMDGIAVDLKQKYKGDVNGKLKILGTALNPILAGDIQLSNGQVFLPETADTTPTILGIAPTVVVAEAAAPTQKPIQLRDLHFTLGDNLQITRAPILNFIATGKIDLEGTIDNPRPFGQVKLQKGSVNLFTTQFRLTSDPQTADFFPTLGTDPVLNLRLYARTLESNSSIFAQRNSIARTASNGEIDRPADFYTTSLGSVQTVQVEARVAGLASQITQRLELTSTPARTQPEIVLLLGGALAERLTSGGDIGLGVISLASSNLLNSLQDRISDVLSLSDFRLFPTITKDPNTNSNSTFGIAAEIGTNITPKVSTSVFKILTNGESPYYSIRYRINDQFLLRGSTNLFGENRAVVEFEQRF